MTSWAEETTRRIGRAIRKARDKQSAQAVSERTKQLGHHISRTAISEYENGKRKTVPITDLLVLSIALKTPLALLLYPDYPDGEVDFLPVVSTTSDVAADALVGRFDFTRTKASPLLWQIELEVAGRLLSTTRHREQQKYAAFSTSMNAEPAEAERIKEDWKRKEAEINDVIKLYGGTVRDA